MLESGFAILLELIMQHISGVPGEMQREHSVKHGRSNQVRDTWSNARKYTSLVTSGAERDFSFIVNWSGCRKLVVRLANILVLQRKKQKPKLQCSMPYNCECCYNRGRLTNKVAAVNEYKNAAAGNWATTRYSPGLYNSGKMATMAQHSQHNHSHDRTSPAHTHITNRPRQLPKCYHKTWKQTLHEQYTDDTTGRQ